MKFDIIPIKQEHKDEVFSMMKEFYSSPAVYTNGSDVIFKNDIENCINNNPFLEGYVFTNDINILGYAMVAKSFSTEFGKLCIWYEDLYLKPQYRGLGIIPIFFEYIETKYPNCVYRLEVEQDNIHACHVYNKLGFEELPYMEMKKQSKSVYN